MKDEIRLKRLRELLAKLNEGEHVQNRRLETLLGSQAYRQMEVEWGNQLALREQLEDKPSEIVEYERRLKRALFTYSKADSHRKNSTVANQLFSQAEVEFEKLLEYLQEIIGADPGLQVWFDRNTDYSVGTDLSPSPEGVPQTVTSKSLNRQGEGLAGGKMSKNAIKIQAVEHAIAALENDEDPEQQQKLLKAKLSALKAERDL